MAKRRPKTGVKAANNGHTPTWVASRWCRYAQRVSARNRSGVFFYQPEEPSVAYFSVQFGWRTRNVLVINGMGKKHGCTSTVFGREIYRVYTFLAGAPLLYARTSRARVVKQLARTPVANFYGILPFSFLRNTIDCAIWLIAPFSCCNFDVCRRCPVVIVLPFFLPPPLTPLPPMCLLYFMLL